MCYNCLTCEKEYLVSQNIQLGHKKESIKQAKIQIPNSTETLKLKIFVFPNLKGHKTTSRATNFVLEIFLLSLFSRAQITTFAFIKQP